MVVVTGRKRKAGGHKVASGGSTVGEGFVYAAEVRGGTGTGGAEEQLLWQSSGTRQRKQASPNHISPVIDTKRQRV